MYSRQFYHIEDVCAGLQYAIHNEESYEAIFWAKELIDINELDLLKKTLFMSWFYSIGLSNLNILDTIKNPTYESIFQIASCRKRNCTLPYMLLNGTLDKTYKVKKSLAKLSTPLQQENQEIENWIRRTLAEKYLESWQLSLNIWEHDNFENMLQQLVSTKFDRADTILECIETIYNFDFIDITYRRCAIIGIVCMNDNTIEVALENTQIKTNSNEINLYLEYYKSVYGKRYGRIYGLQANCFYGKTKRGTMKKSETNIKELYDPDILLKNQKINNLIVSVFGSFEAFKENHDEYEKLYSYYFPDDIPDEWSLIEQTKSHGNGILEEHEKPSIEKYFSVWTKGESYIENTNEILQEYSKKKYTFNFEHDILNYYNKSFNMKSLQMELDTL